MSYIPDCRSDEHYNAKYLNEKDYKFVRGYDWAVEQEIDNFFDNLEVTESDRLIKMMEEPLPKELVQEYEVPTTFNGDESQEYETRTAKTYGDLLRMNLLRWAECGRDELITSIIDGMTDEEYQAIKEKVDGRSEEENGQRAPEDGEETC